LAAVAIDMSGIYNEILPDTHIKFFSIPFFQVSRFDAVYVFAIFFSRVTHIEA